MVTVNFDQKMETIPNDVFPLQNIVQIIVIIVTTVLLMAVIIITIRIILHR